MSIALPLWYNAAMQLLQDQVIVITGASGALAAAVTKEALALGAKCALLSRSEVHAPKGAKWWAADVAALAGASRAMDDVAAQFGRIDALVNVAGSFMWQPLAQSADLSEWEEMHASNLMTCVHACKAVLPHLVRSGAGRIVSIGAASALQGTNGMGAYAASKAGVMRLTETLAQELKHQHITVNAVLPGVIDTPRNRADMPDADPRDWVSTGAIARVIAFLLSPAAASVTGALLPVTGPG